MYESKARKNLISFLFLKILKFKRQNFFIRNKFSCKDIAIKYKNMVKKKITKLNRNEI